MTTYTFVLKVIFKMWIIVHADGPKNSHGTGSTKRKKYTFFDRYYQSILFFYLLRLHVHIFASHSHKTHPSHTVKM